MQEPVCKCCGQTLPPKFTAAGYLSPGPLRIVELVHRAGKRGIRSDRLFNALYDDHPDGGPLSGMNSLRVRIAKINRKHLEPAGWKIEGENTGCNEFGSYKLVNIDA